MFRLLLASLILATLYMRHTSGQITTEGSQKIIMKEFKEIIAEFCRGNVTFSPVMNNVFDCSTKAVSNS